MESSTASAMKRTRSCGSNSNQEPTPEKNEVPTTPTTGEPENPENHQNVENPENNQDAENPENNQDAENPEKVCFLEAVPDHLIARFLKLLDVEQLILCIPQVCKRWNRLSKSEELWEGVDLFYESYQSASEKKIFFSCMKMAPKVHSVTLDLHYRDGHEFAEQLNLHSPREVTALHLIYDNMPPEAMFVLLSKYKNHLVKLAITDTFTPYVETDLKRIWNHIQNLTKLKHLTVAGSALFYHKATFRKSLPCWETLQILDVQECGYEEMNTVQRMIACNSNWTEVYLAASDNFRGEVKVLSKCLNLQTVQASFCKEIKLLQKCKKLDSLIIDCIDDTSQEIDGVVTSLCKSTVFPNLKAVKLMNGKAAYGKFLRCLLQEHPNIILLNLASMKISPEDLLQAMENAQGVEKFILHEPHGQFAETFLNGVSKGFLPNLKMALVSECSCEEEENVCVKQAFDQVKELRPGLDLVLESVECSCQPKVNVPKNSTEEEKKIETVAASKRPGPNNLSKKGGKKKKL